MASKRMIFDLPPEVQMAIRIRAIKNNVTTGEVVRMAMESAFPEDVKQAEVEELLKERKS